MTNSEKIASLVRAYETDTNVLDGALVDAGLSPSAEYQVTNKTALFDAAVFVLQTTREVVSQSEGGYSITYKSGIDSLIKALGSDTPTVRALHVW